MIPDINQGNILRVMDCYTVYRETHFAQEKAAVRKLDLLNREELWLLSFVQHMVFWNKIWRTLDDSPYCLVPRAPVQRASFEDFLKLLRYYAGHKVTQHNEKALVVFLSNCTEEFREFYLSILSRQEWLRQFYRMKSARNYIDRSLIHQEDIYGELKIYRARFGELPFPVMVSAVPRKLPSGMLCKTNKNPPIAYVFRGESKVSLGQAWLKMDRQFVDRDRFVLMGLIDQEGGCFYPTDYFTADDYQRYTRGLEVPPYYRRLQSLDAWLSCNYLRQIKRVPKEYVASPAEIDNAVRRVLAGSNCQTLVFTKENYRRFMVETKEVKGVIEGVWTEQGVAKGFLVWHNTRLLQCSYTFTGSANLLLFKPEVLKARVVKFWLFKFEDFLAGAVKEILWDEKPFCRSLKLDDGTTTRIEKCAYCAKDSTTVQQKYRAICYNTMCNLQALLGKWGADVWIKPTPAIERLRDQTAWEPYLLNNVGFTYKGYRMICRESDGYLMFQSDPEVMERYLALINDDSPWSQWVREHRLRFVTEADLRKRYLKLMGVEGRDGEDIEGQGEEGAAGVQESAAGAELDFHGVEGGGRG